MIWRKKEPNNVFIDNLISHLTWLYLFKALDWSLNMPFCLWDQTFAVNWIAGHQVFRRTYCSTKDQKQTKCKEVFGWMSCNCWPSQRRLFTITVFVDISSSELRRTANGSSDGLCCSRIFYSTSRTSHRAVLRGSSSWKDRIAIKWYIHPLARDPTKHKYATYQLAFLKNCAHFGALLQ